MTTPVLGLPRVPRIMLRALDVLQADAAMTRLVDEEVAERGLTRADGWPLVMYDVWTAMLVAHVEVHGRPEKAS